MKYKLLLLLIVSSFTIYIIFNNNYHNIINITSINSLSMEENYNEYLSNYLSNSNVNYKINVDFTNKELEIENVQALLNNNTNNIQSILHNSEVIIISIGNNDKKTEDYKTIIKELEELFKSIRNVNSKQIIYVSPYTIKNTTYIKELCNKYKIIYINGSSFYKKANLLAQIIYKKIESNYNKESSK